MPECCVCHQWNKMGHRNCTKNGTWTYIVPQQQTEKAMLLKWIFTTWLPEIEVVCYDTFVIWDILLLSRCTYIVVQTLQVFVTSQLCHLLRGNIVLNQTCSHCLACTVVGFFNFQFQLLCTSPCNFQACLYQLVVSCTSIYQWGCLHLSDKAEGQETNILGTSGLLE